MNKYKLEKITRKGIIEEHIHLLTGIHKNWFIWTKIEAIVFRWRAINYILHVLTKYPVHLKRKSTKNNNTKKYLAFSFLFFHSNGFSLKGKNMWQYFLKSFISYNNFDNNTDYFFLSKSGTAFFPPKVSYVMGVLRNIYYSLQRKYKLIINLCSIVKECALKNLQWQLLSKYNSVLL